MACLQPVYRPRDAEHPVLHQVIGEHLEALLREAAAAGEGVGLAQLVEREFREFLTCGAFEHGSARCRGEGCAHEPLVPLSCKGRGSCPGCGRRRMTERAAHLVDEGLLHTLALDGVFSEANSGALEFHPAPGSRDAEVAEALATVRHRVRRLSVRRGLEPGDEATGPVDRLAEESPVLAGIASASVQGRVALGPSAGPRVADPGGRLTSRP